MNNIEAEGELQLSKVKNENYILIQGFMVNELKLKGNELLIYAIIYGFSQTDNQVFNGSLQYLSDWTNSTKQGVIKNLKSLVEKGFIKKNEKFINGVKFCEYYSTEFNTLLNKVDQGSKQSLIPIKQSLMGGSKQSLTNNKELNNINNNLINNKEENIKEENVLSSPNVIDIKKSKKEREEEILKNEFNSLWNLYPRKMGKENAFKSYCKHRRDGNFKEDIEKGLERYLKYIRENNIDDKYIKHGSTWFNQKGWEDVYPEKYVPEWLYSDTNSNEEVNDEEYDDFKEVVNDFREMFGK